MALNQQDIDVGAAPNDGQGDPIRTAFIKCNDNFTQLYSLPQPTPPATLVGQEGDIPGMYAYDSSYFYYCFAEYDGSTAIWAELAPIGNVSATAITNGTSSLAIANPNGNITVRVGGVSNVAVFRTTGEFINGVVSATGTITGGNLAGANITGTNIVGSSISSTGTIVASSDISANNVSVTGYLTTGTGFFAANAYPGAFDDGIVMDYVPGQGRISVGADDDIVFYHSGVGNTAIVSFDSSGNITTGGTFNSTGNIVTQGIVSATGNIETSGYFVGTFVGNVTGNFVVPGSNTQVIFNTAGNADAVGGFTYNKDSNTMTVLGIVSSQGNVIGGNIRTAGSVSATGNITGGNLITAGSFTAASFSTAGNVSSGNIQSTGFISATGAITSGAAIAATTTISAAGNITGANLLTSGSVTATGNIRSASNFYALGDADIGGNITGTNINGSTASVTGTITGGNLATGGTISAAGNITGGNLNIAGSTTFSGNISGTNIQASGNVSATGNITGANLSLSGAISAVGSISGGNITGSNISTPGNFSSGGTIVTPATITGGNLVTTGNVAGSNLVTDGAVTTTGNVIGNIINGNIITGGNLVISGNISVTGESFQSNVSTTGNIVSVGTLTVNSSNNVTAIVNGGSNATGNIGSSSKYFNRLFATATTALYADLAENYQADAEYAPGTVLSFGGNNEVTISSEDSDPCVAGVVSTNPAYHMNSGLVGENVVALALTGRVPCLVKGPVNKGSMMVSAGQGYARAEKSPAIGTVIGKAIESFDGDIGTIEIVVGRL